MVWQVQFEILTFKRNTFPGKKATVSCGVLLILLGWAAVLAAETDGWSEPWGSCGSGKVVAIGRTEAGFAFLVNTQTGPTRGASLITVDEMGGIRSTVALGDGQELIAGDLAILADGTSIVCGSVAGADQSDFCLAAVNSSGVIRQRAWGGAGAQGLHALAVDARGSLVVAGFAVQGGREDTDFYLAKCDPQGEPVWSRQIGSPADEKLTAVCVTDDQFIIAAGQRAVAREGTMIVVMKASRTGEVMWQRSYRLENMGRVADVCATPDGGALVVSLLAGLDRAAHALQVDALGEPQWQKTYYLGERGSDELRVLRDKHGYTIAAYSFGCESARRDLQILQLDRRGEPLWHTCYHTDGADSLVEGLKVWFGEAAGEVKLAVRGPRLMGKRMDKWAVLIAFEVPQHAPLRLLLSDIHGRRVETLKDVICSPGRHSMWWNATDKPNGVYVVRLETPDGVRTEKFVVMK